MRPLPVGQSPITRRVLLASLIAVCQCHRFLRVGPTFRPGVQGERRHPHDCRNTNAGFTAAARRVGRRTASVAAPSGIAAAPTNAMGSCGETPKRIPATTRLANRADERRLVVPVSPRHRLADEGHRSRSRNLVGRIGATTQNLKADCLEVVGARAIEVGDDSSRSVARDRRSGGVPEWRKFGQRDRCDARDALQLGNRARPEVLDADTIIIECVTQSR